MLAERRLLARGELEPGSAIRLLEEIPPHDLPEALAAMAEDAAGCRVGMYVVEIGGSVLRLVAATRRGRSSCRSARASAAS